MSGEADHVGTRARIVETLRESPGLGPSEVAEREGMHPSTADYHLRRLAREGRVTRVRSGRELHHYPVGEGWCKRSRIVHARLTDAGRAVLRLGLDRGVFPRRAIVEQGFSASAVRWALELLGEVGVVERLAWGVYELPSRWQGCVVAALRERPCTVCNETGAAPEAREAHERGAGQERRRATISPSPSGRIETSRSG